jgi:hypothetical protein
MRKIFLLLPLALAACALPGRQTLAPASVGADTASIDATQAQSPAAPSPDTSASELQSLAPTASAVAKSIVGDGVAPDHVSLSAKTAGLDADILVYVK